MDVVGVGWEQGTGTITMEGGGESEHRHVRTGMLVKRSTEGVEVARVLIGFGVLDLKI